MNKNIFLIKLRKEEERIRKTIIADAGDFEELQSEWQERDSAAERNLREVEWDQYSSLQKELAEIEEAKTRIEKGVYGKCVDCDDAISAKRLSVVLTARRCIECQQNNEINNGIIRKTTSL